MLFRSALVFIAGDLVKLIWGREDQSTPMPGLLSGAVQALGLTFPRYRLFLIVMGLAIAAGLWWLLHRTRWGILIRAATNDRDMLGALGTDTRRLGPTESVTVPLGAAHRLVNPVKEDLHLIEVQSGAYVGEDDIERLDDAYGRA